MFRLIALGAALLPTVCSGTTTNVQVIDLTDASSGPDAGWLGAPCDPSAADSCAATLGLTCAGEHTSLPEDVYGTCVYACGTSIEVTQCAAWNARCLGADSGSGAPLYGYCVPSDGGTEQ